MSKGLLGNLCCMRTGLVLGVPVFRILLAFTVLTFNSLTTSDEKS